MITGKELKNFIKTKKADDKRNRKFRKARRELRKAKSFIKHQELIEQPEGGEQL